MSPSRLALLTLILLLTGHPAAAQSELNAVKPISETGIHAFGAYDGTQENISLSNGNLNIVLPLLTFPGRGTNFALSVEYDSKTIDPQIASLSPPDFDWNWQKDVRVPMITPDLRLSVPTLALTIGACQGLQNTQFDWLYTEPNGSKHHFGKKLPCNTPLGTMDSDDAALLRIDPTNASDWVVRLKDGTSVHFLGGLTRFGTGGTPQVFDSIVDTNGNTIQSTSSNGQLSTITDTVGRVFTFDLTNHTISYNDANGAPQTITFTQVGSSPGSITLTHPQGTECGFNVTVPPNGDTFNGQNTTWAIKIPNGAAGLTYQLQLDVLGELTKISYPAGGYTKYDYQPYVATYNWPHSAVFCSSVDFREVVAKHECRRSDGNCGPSPAPTAEDTTTYSATISGEANQFMDVFSPDPSGTPNKTHYEFTLPNPLLNEYVSLEINRLIYTGSSTLVRTIHTDYNQITVSGTTTFYDGSLPIGVTTTLNDASPNLVSKAETDYDTAALNNKWSNGQQLPISNATEGREFDYGLVLARKTDTQWLKTGEYAIDQKHILDRKSLVTTSNGSGAQVAQTSYEYDNYTEGLSASNSTQHQAEDNVRGNLTATARWLNTTNTFLPSTRYQFDDAGNVRKIVDPLLHSTTISYADSWRQNSCIPSSGQAAAYPTITTNALGQATLHTYDSCSGSAATVTDPNLQLTTYTYDSLGRAVLASYPDHGSTGMTYSDTAPTSVTRNSAISTSPAVVNKISTVTYDGLGRSVQDALTSDPDGSTFTVTAFDSLDRPGQIYNPTRCNNPPTTNCGESTWGVTTTFYDALNRSCLVVPPDGTLPSGNACPTSQPSNTIFTTYSGNCTTVTDQAGKARKSCSDALGRLIQVIEDPVGVSYETDYGYDALDNLLCAAQKGTNSGTFSGCSSIPVSWRPRSFVYDSLSRLTSATNPESGTISYAYDANGNLSSKTAPAPNQTGSATVTTTNTYDALNRLTQKSYSDGTTPAATFTYDLSSIDGYTIAYPVGRLVKSATAGTYPTRNYYYYDQMGRVLHQGSCGYVNCANSLWVVINSYDLMGNLTSYTDANGVTLTQSFDSAGRPSQLTSSWVDSSHPATLITADPSSGYFATGALRKATLASGLTETNVLNSRLQPCRLNLNSSGTSLVNCTDPTPGGSLLDFAYGFNSGAANNGNLASWSAVGQQAFSRTYTYDALNRINTMADSNTSQTCRGLSWNIDAWGNRTDQNFTAGTTCNTFHQAVNTKNQFVEGSYDAAGNLLSDGTHAYVYDAENRIYDVDGGNTAIYVYDADGRRVAKGVGSSSTYYIYGSDGQVVSQRDGGNNWLLTYIHFGGKLTALYSGSGTYFFHQDHLGSTRLGTDLNKNVTLNNDYLPFGEQIAGGNATSIKFTGKERDTETASSLGGLDGLDYFGARYNSSNLGRFMSPDDAFVGWEEYDPQSLNIYGYVRNDPSNQVDDDGHQALPGGSCTSLWCLLSELVHAVFGGGGAHEDVTTHIVSSNPDFSNPASNGMLRQQIPGQNNLTLEDLSIQGRQKMVEGFKFTRDSEIQFTALFIFPEADIEEVLLSSERMASPQITAGARAIAKKLGHALSEGVKSAFQGTPVEQQAARTLIRDIMKNNVKVIRLGKYTDVYNAAGQGLRIENGTNKFITFLEIAKAARLIP